MSVSPEVRYEVFYFKDIQFSTFALYAVSSTSDISLTTVVSSAYLTMTLVGWVGIQSYVYRAYSRGLRTQPCGCPVLSDSGEERWGLRLIEVSLLGSL